MERKTLQLGNRHYCQFYCPHLKLYQRTFTYLQAPSLLPLTPSPVFSASSISPPPRSLVRSPSPGPDTPDCPQLAFASCSVAAAARLATSLAGSPGPQCWAANDWSCPGARPPPRCPSRIALLGRTWSSGPTAVAWPPPCRTIAPRRWDPGRRRSSSSSCPLAYWWWPIVPTAAGGSSSWWSTWVGAAAPSPGRRRRDKSPWPHSCRPGWRRWCPRNCSSLSMECRERNNFPTRNPVLIKEFPPPRDGRGQVVHQSFVVVVVESQKTGIHPCPALFRLPRIQLPLTLATGMICQRGEIPSIREDLGTCPSPGSFFGAQHERWSTCHPLLLWSRTSSVTPLEQFASLVNWWLAGAENNNYFMTITWRYLYSCG